jgi:hypothetical protein
MLGIIKEQEQNKNNNPQVQYNLNMFIFFVFITGNIFQAHSIINLNYLIYKSLQKQQEHHSRKKLQTKDLFVKWLSVIISIANSLEHLIILSVHFLNF